MSQPDTTLPSEGRQARNNQRQKPRAPCHAGMRAINTMMTTGQVAAWELPPRDVCLWLACIHGLPNPLDDEPLGPAHDWHDGSAKVDLAGTARWSSHLDSLQAHSGMHGVSAYTL